MTTGFGHGTVLSVAGQVVDAVKRGEINTSSSSRLRRRKTWTQLLQPNLSNKRLQTALCSPSPAENIASTISILGTVAACHVSWIWASRNDAYSAIQVAVALAEAFGCGVNDLPLSMVLSASGYVADGIDPALFTWANVAKNLTAATLGNTVAGVTLAMLYRAACAKR